jgi:hypothetical protein
MRWTLCAAVGVLLVIALTGCREARPERVELLPPETFTWTTGQPISFGPPPDEWRRSRYQNGGAEGVDFVLQGSKGEQILVAERFFLGRRDRCGTIRHLLEELGNLGRLEVERELRRARLQRRPAFNDAEEGAAEAVNRLLDQALEAFRLDQPALTHEYLRRALEQAGTIRYTVDQTVHEVLFTGEGSTVYPRLEVAAPVAGEVAGRRALEVHFRFEGHGLPMIGRRVYVVASNRMFELGFQGQAEHLPVFTAVLGSVTFPPGVCTH